MVREKDYSLEKCLFEKKVVSLQHQLSNKMCTYNITLNDSLVEQARSVFANDDALQQWLQKRLTDYATYILTLSVHGREEDYSNVVDDLTEDERAYWTESIERDMRKIAEGKSLKYISGDEFWAKFEDAVKSYYEGVQS